MAERTETGVMKVGVPSYLANRTEPDTSLANVSEHHILPRLNCIQGLTPEQKKGSNSVGDVILSPGYTLLVKRNEPVLFVPLFKFTEYIQYRDRKDQSDSPIVAKTFDAEHIIARKARSPEHRVESYGEIDQKTGKPAFTMQFVETIQFATMIYSGDLKGTVANLSFAKGEFATGRAFCSAITQRRVNGQHVPLWAQVYELVSHSRTKHSNTWWGFDVNNPASGSPFVAESDAEGFEKMFKDLEKKFNSGLLGVDEGLGQTAQEPIADDGRM